MFTHGTVKQGIREVVGKTGGCMIISAQLEPNCRNGLTIQVIGHQSRLSLSGLAEDHHKWFAFVSVQLFNQTLAMDDGRQLRD